MHPKEPETCSPYTPLEEEKITEFLYTWLSASALLEALYTCEEEIDIILIGNALNMRLETEGKELD